MTWPTTSRQSRGYDREHERQRDALLKREPLCRECNRKGRTTVATIADHIVPRSKGGLNVESNYAPLCQACSNAKTIREAGHRPRPRIGADGWPDPKST